jgi:hypothetical protein
VEVAVLMVEIVNVVELEGLVAVVEVVEETTVAHLDGELMDRCQEQQLPVVVVEANLSGLQMKVYQQPALVVRVLSLSNGHK